MDKLNIYFIVFSLTDKIEDPTFFECSVQYNLIVATPILREIINNFADTLPTLLSYSDEDIDYLMKETHGVNSARTANLEILIPQSAISGLASVLFGVKNREICNNLPTLAILQNINASHPSLKRKTRHSTITTEKAKRNVTLTDMEVPKLTPTTVEDWHTAFTSVVGKQTSLSGISLDYLLRSNSFGDYELNWLTREDKLHICISITSHRFKTDSESLDPLLIQHIGTFGCGYDSTTKYKSSKNGRTCHLEIKSHFHNGAHLPEFTKRRRSTISSAP